MVPADAIQHSLERLLSHVRSAPDRDTLLDVCLDTLVELSGADRGLILLTEAGKASYVVNARAEGRALEWKEREEISHSIVREALDAGRRVVWRTDPMAVASNESMIQLGIQFAVAEPILPPAWRRGGSGAPRGVVYLDYRSPRRALGADAYLELIAAATGLIAIILDPLEELAVQRERQRELAAGRGEPGVPLAELMAPRSMAKLKAEIDAALLGTTPLLILGESGTGKTLLARAIAEASGRLPVVRATLGSSDDLNTITSELFGHERGSFSGALARRKGLVEFAEGGTLILDELLNLPLPAQRLLLDFTQFGTYRPLGYDRPEPRRASLRIIAVTNGDLEAAVAAGRFRQDLYFRLAGTRLEIPPLRERYADAPALAEALLLRNDPRDWQVSLQVRRVLASPQLPWPGNVRQFEMAILRARDRALAEDPGASRLELRHLSPRDLELAALPSSGPPEPAPPAAAATAPAPAPELIGSWRELEAARSQLDQRERAILERALETHDGVVAHAARELGLPRTSMISRMQSLGVRWPKLPTT